MPVMLNASLLWKATPPPLLLGRKSVKAASRKLLTTWRRKSWKSEVPDYHLGLRIVVI
jgi:hypothetical protein